MNVPGMLTFYLRLLLSVSLYIDTFQLVSMLRRPKLPPHLPVPLGLTPTGDLIPETCSIPWTKEVVSGIFLVSYYQK